MFETPHNKPCEMPKQAAHLLLIDPVRVPASCERAGYADRVVGEPVLPARLSERVA